VAFIVLLDATALFGSALRNVLLLAHDRGIYQAKFTDAILEETRGAVLRKYPDADMDRTLELIRENFDDALVRNYERLVPVMTNDPGDRHVLAAAVACGAQLIVTENTGHFPDESCAIYNIEVKTADEFLQDLWDLDAEGVVATLVEAVAGTTRPRLDVVGVLEKLRAVAPQFVAGALTSPLIRQ
jgi:PIN domain-containing protein